MQLKGHLQIEDGLVPWGEAHHAISSALLDTLKNERQEMRKLIATLVNRRRRSNAANHRGRTALTRTLLALARTLDSTRRALSTPILILTHLGAKSLK